MMEVSVITGAIRRAKLQSDRQHQQTNTQLFVGPTPFLSPNQQRQSYPIPRTCTDGSNGPIQPWPHPVGQWDLASSRQRSLHGITGTGQFIIHVRITKAVIRHVF